MRIRRYGYLICSSLFSKLRLHFTSFIIVNITCYLFLCNMDFKKNLQCQQCVVSTLCGHFISNVVFLVYMVSDYLKDCG